MTTLTVIIQEPPYVVGNKAWHALRLAGASMVEGMTVQVFLLEKGVELARRGQQPPEGCANLEDLLNELIECGLSVEGCGMCLKNCCLPESELIPGVSRGSMKSLAAWIGASDNVLTF
jgi:sulfur relay (sulfurtransferase) complex TusBCD TusD component (DsrE family)